MRVIGRVRLSKTNEGSTSVSRQRELIEAWAERHEHEIVGWAEDVDISGGVDPFDTPQLGSYLTPERMPEWDILVAWKLDRLSRKAINLSRLFEHLLEHEKTLVCIDDSIDLSTIAGRMIATILGYIAEGELEAIKLRTKASRAKLVSTGRYPGGIPSFGYTPTNLPGGGWILEPDPEKAELVNTMADMLLDGESGQSIAAWLNSNGVLSYYGKTWSTVQVRRILGNKTLLGVHANRFDEEGNPLRFAEPVMSYEKFRKVQARLKATSLGKGTKRNAWPLSGVLECWKCGGDLKGRMSGDKSRKNRYYICGRCKGTVHGLKADLIEPLVYDYYLSELGDSEQMEQVDTGSADAEKIAETQEAIENLAGLVGSLSSPTALASITERIQELDKQLATLQSQGQGLVWKSTGVLNKDVWEGLDTEGKRKHLIKTGIRVRARGIDSSTVFETEFIKP